ncbi:MAG: transposase [Candidatus Sericytochromatia bacterium]|nr:transposase [Candidatus Tanganyikabacteria bacterium]
MQDRTTPLPLPIACGKKVFAAFDVAGLTSDGGISFVRSVDDRLGLTASLAALLPDPRDLRYVTHSALDLLRQRVYSIVAGYEDLNDAARLRGDPALKLAVGRDALDSDADLGSPATL